VIRENDQGGFGAINFGWVFLLQSIFRVQSDCRALKRGLKATLFSRAGNFAYMLRVKAEAVIQKAENCSGSRLQILERSRFECVGSEE